MKNSKLVSFTLKPATAEKLNEFAKIKSINKSALVDKLINDAITKEIEQYLFDQEENIPNDILCFMKKHIDILNLRKKYVKITIAD